MNEIKRECEQDRWAKKPDWEKIKPPTNKSYYNSNGNARHRHTKKTIRNKTKQNEKKKIN